MANHSAAAGRPGPTLAEAIDAYVRGVWAAWSPHRDQVADWAGAAS